MEYKISPPQKPKIIKKGENRAIFEIDGCYPGYGLTIGNAFRRVLLSSLAGAAITAVKIRGVSHEFSTIPHVLEDVIHIILNLKQIRFKVNAPESLPLKVGLKVVGEKQVKAKDIKLTAELEIINKDAYIATLTDKKAKLEMEIEIQGGLGYMPVEQRKKEKLEIGAIAIDAVFTPVKKINYEVENMRVGDRTDFNRLRIDVETDGSISPEDAMMRAADILVDHFQVLASPKEVAEERGKTKETVGKIKKPRPQKTKRAFFKGRRGKKSKK
ncbi:MAG: DNA-directed RNA polymerase subunit alpha [Candidatus Portnoybacteria bacterium CG10_big_fil_rev_8_21_14_0_10_38_18]|uniref:DNA-directed RNA polymerase subunit alpha n=1 Tax=Candidatus Portnoybacteria bacterium CG10_big_fil_rev_8_21_14_0_10_38_18 TaxID=1974813 RepID=A0A2M8KCS5_9BACT|nr:MAG: DNA-directed RNA polymerase subunit alpha [Candidatus Portnoybacteria bacterium CG10_big_fil_rev_8_21_14_0_10_38_18]